MYPTTPHIHPSHISPPLFFLFSLDPLSFQPPWALSGSGNQETCFHIPKMAPAGGEGERGTWLTGPGLSVLPIPPWLSGSRAGPCPIYQLKSQALKLETSQTDKGELGGGR